MSASDDNTSKVIELGGGSSLADPFVGDQALKPAFFDWLCRMGDSALVLAHRTSEWCGHGPVLEEDIALANTALDLIGHTQMWLGLAGEVEGEGRTADNLAYLRDAMKYRNLLICELPKGDMGVTLMREFLFDVYHHELLNWLAQNSTSPRVVEIAAKAIKEVTYHLERASDLVIRLGDGTAESHQRMQDALDLLWPYTGEMFTNDAVDEAIAAAGIAPQPADLHAAWESAVREVLDEARLAVPASNAYSQQGGKLGRHTEHLGYILADMQFLQRAYPGATW
ncbi:MAG: phenylacetate-CoA oxygenase subunit PaaC [Gammaproteobacteria bacterium]|nr:phenylacetate-CoA oxygenase subunit PaaC [Gammaproteobacteria bacterium]